MVCENRHQNICSCGSSALTKKKKCNKCNIVFNVCPICSGKTITPRESNNVSPSLSPQENFATQTPLKSGGSISPSIRRLNGAFIGSNVVPIDQVINANNLTSNNLNSNNLNSNNLGMNNLARNNLTRNSLTSNNLGMSNPNSLARNNLGMNNPNNLGMSNPNSLARNNLGMNNPNNLGMSNPNSLARNNLGINNPNNLGMNNPNNLGMSNPNSLARNNLGMNNPNNLGGNNVTVARQYYNPENIGINWSRASGNGLVSPGMNQPEGIVHRSGDFNDNVDSNNIFDDYLKKENQIIEDEEELTENNKDENVESFEISEDDTDTTYSYRRCEKYCYIKGQKPKIFFHEKKNGDDTAPRKTRSYRTPQPEIPRDWGNEQFWWPSNQDPYDRNYKKFVLKEDDSKSDPKKKKERGKDGHHQKSDHRRKNHRKEDPYLKDDHHQRNNHQRNDDHRNHRKEDRHQRNDRKEDPYLKEDHRKGRNRKREDRHQRSHKDQ